MVFQLNIYREQVGNYVLEAWKLKRTDLGEWAKSLDSEGLESDYPRSQAFNESEDLIRQPPFGETTRGGNDGACFREKKKTLILIMASIAEIASVFRQNGMKVPIAQFHAKLSGICVPSTFFSVNTRGC
ncbi:hypothetical protein Nepgr_025880 [Nepenthes gracilis]|uniref:Uncharacterized protein n=1 Tax=Nepenthes gracilis TaxID=150966 RepID=A0AAD3T7B9_NEPGR|nr:hypothetical protein Nepgr_025880 [Nepenthes gracilis]